MQVITFRSIQNEFNGILASKWQNQSRSNKRKRPSVDLARKMVSFSDGALSFEELLFPLDEKKK